MKIKKCPEGHICTSMCRREGCPCFEHRHTILSELGKLGGQQTAKRGKAYYSRIGKLGMTKRWGKKKPLPA